VYSNLEKILTERHISSEMLAKMLDLDGKTVRNKLSGQTDFKLQEVYAINALFPEYDQRWLFAKTEEA